jgi:hypothetical protein
MVARTYSTIQQEVIVLAAVLDLIDDMVNLRTFGPPITDRPTNLLPNTSTDQRIFAILLGDFLSLPKPHRGDAMPFGLSVPTKDEKGSARTYLRYLREITANPSFSGNIGPLANEVDAFAVWLDAELTCHKVWLGDLNIEFDMTVERIWVFKAVGDLAKHNFSRLEGQIRPIQNMLVRHGFAVEEGEIYGALPNIEEWLRGHILAYHTSTIAEFLNNIRWAIYGYLRPEFVRAFRRESACVPYTFDVPAAIGQGLPRGMYWRLMNAMRSEPHFPRFEVAASLKVNL